MRAALEDLSETSARQNFSRSEPLPDKISSDHFHKEVRQFWVKKQQCEARTSHFILRNWRFFLSTAIAFCRLPRIEAHLSQSESGRKIRRYLTRICFFKFIRLNAIGVCLLVVPKLPERYDAGSQKQTLRRKARSALRAGVTWRVVDDVQEQRELVARLDRALSTKTRYRQIGSDHSYLVGSGLWMVAHAADGAPLLIAVTPYDGEWALLQAFLTFDDTPLHSDTRYLAAQMLVERLSSLGVRYLFDGRSPHQLPVGLWQFQQMLGFQMARVRLR